MKTDYSINILKSGLYTLREAANYSRLHYKTLYRWAEISGIKILDDNKIMSFLDFIQALAIRDIRRQHNIPLQKIREALEIAKKKYNVDYPFAKEHTTYLFGKDIYISLEKEENPIQLSGKGEGQLAMRKIIELYMKDLCFGSTGFAIEYKPIQGIIMNPKFRFGEPLVERVKIPAIVLWEAFQSEGSLEAASEAYGVTIEDVYTASKYIETLDLKAA
jgi:uncharacterized protein (DUF433 family)/DNA-binding transcriptional MerR regulator